MSVLLSPAFIDKIITNGLERRTFNVVIIKTFCTTDVRAGKGIVTLATDNSHLSIMILGNSTEKPADLKYLDNSIVQVKISDLVHVEKCNDVLDWISSGQVDVAKLNGAICSCPNNDGSSLAVFIIKSFKLIARGYRVTKGLQHVGINQRAIDTHGQSAGILNYNVDPFLQELARSSPTKSPRKLTKRTPTPGYSSTKLFKSRK